jgi:GNAT superfamily N-acetyltransferase
MPGCVLVRMKTLDDAATCEVLFREYGQWSADLLGRDYGIAFGDDELDRAHAEFRNEWPALLSSRGRLYLATVEGEAAGVGALKPMTQETAELKRVYTRPAYRGGGVGRRLVSQLLDDARELAYDAVRLETMTYMTEAHALYRSLGFVDIEGFPAEGARFGLDACELFMELEL